MDHFEQELSKLRLSAPSTDLDRRVAATFSAIDQRPRRGSRRSVFWWWLGAVAVGGAATIVLLMVSVDSMRSRPAPLVYRIEAQGRLREMLLNPVEARPEPAPFVARTAPN